MATKVDQKDLTPNGPQSDRSVPCGGQRTPFRDAESVAPLVELHVQLTNLTSTFMHQQQQIHLLSAGCDAQPDTFDFPKANALIDSLTKEMKR